MPCSIFQKLKGFANMKSGPERPSEPNVTNVICRAIVKLRSPNCLHTKVSVSVKVLSSGNKDQLPLI